MDYEILHYIVDYTIKDKNGHLYKHSAKVYSEEDALNTAKKLYRKGGLPILTLPIENYWLVLWSLNTDLN